MIDWKRAKPDDFKIRFEIEEIIQNGDTLIFPVSIYTEEDEKVFTKGVPIRAEFYFELRELDGWLDALKKIIKSRIREDIMERIKTGKMTVKDKVELLGERESL